MQRSPPPAEDLSPTQFIQVPQFFGSAHRQDERHDPEIPRLREPEEVVRESARAEVMTAEFEEAAPSSAMELAHRGPMGVPMGLKLEQAGSWQKIWIALQQREWTSVTLVPTNAELGEETVEIAQALGAVGLDHLRRPISVLDVRGVSLGLAETRIAELRSRVARGERVLVVTGPLDENPAELPLATATDAAILCLKLGESRVASAARIVKALGRERFMGAVALRPRPKNGKTTKTTLAKR